MKHIILETDRLMLREMDFSDVEALASMLQDDRSCMPTTVHSMTGKRCFQIQRYNDYGFGLWGVSLRNSDEMIGQCGITLQDYKTTQVPEIGYLFAHKHWHKGYATEAAIACREYGFNKLRFEVMYSIIRDSNEASKNVALRNGMIPIDHITKHYRGIDMPHIVFCTK